MSNKVAASGPMYWVRIVICIVSFGMVFPNALVEGMDEPEIKSEKTGTQ